MGKSHSKPEPPLDSRDDLGERDLARSTADLEGTMLAVGPLDASSASGLWETLAAWFDGLFWDIPESSESIETGTVFAPESPTGRYLVVCPPFQGSPSSAVVKPLVRMALDRGFTVIVHARGDKLQDPDSLARCVEYARSRSGGIFPVGVIGISVGGFEACKANIRGARVVSISNGYDLALAEPHVPLLVRKRFVGLSATSVSEVYGHQTCAGEIARARSPTLLVNSRNDPIVPKCCVDLGELLAARTPMVSSVTTPRGGHVGFVCKGGRRWAYEVALEFCARV